MIERKPTNYFVISITFAIFTLILGAATLFYQSTRTLDSNFQMAPPMAANISMNLIALLIVGMFLIGGFMFMFNSLKIITGRN